jgi:hypothetical protein
MLVLAHGPFVFVAHPCYLSIVVSVLSELSAHYRTMTDRTSISGRSDSGCEPESESESEEEEPGSDSHNQHHHFPQPPPRPLVENRHWQEREDDTFTLAS